MSKLRTSSIYGYSISQLNMEDTVKLLTEWAQSGESHHVVTINPIMIMDALEKPTHDATMLGADLLVPDGTGVVWAASYLKQPVAERVPGFDLLHKLLDVADQRRWRVYLVGTTAETIKLATERLRARYLGAEFFYRDGFFGEDEDEAVIKQIREVQPHLLFVARSSDLQDPWIHRYREQLNVPVMMGVGGSFDIIAGKLKRAPVLFQKLRLEWLFRLLQQPARFVRMLTLPKFVLRVMRDQGKRSE